MIDTELPFTYDKICMNVRHTLLDYDKYEANIPRKEIEHSLNKMYSKQDRIREKLDIAESNAMGIVNDWETFNQWFSVLKESNEEMVYKEKEDDTQLGRLRLAFSSNANQLKSLQNDVLSCCRKLPDTKESPQVIRLKSVQSKAKEYYEERTHVLSEIDQEMTIADEKFDNVSKENIALTEQNDEFQKQLDLFSNSESFKLVQEARKHRLVEKEWNEKKLQLLSEIENSKKELENYQGNKDQSLRNLVLESGKQDQEIAKLQAKYNEMIQDVINEDNISNTNRATVMKQLYIELDRLKENQLRKEANITRNEIRTLKNKGDRLVSKLKMEVSSSSRTFSQALSKLTEPKPNSNLTPKTENTSNPPRFKNFKGKRKKSASKSPKKGKSKATPAPQEPPPRVYSLQELGYMKLQEDKEKYALFLQTKFEPEIQELKNFFERKVNIHKELLQQELSEILAKDKRQREILMANKIRIQQRISEKEIEISSLNAELVTFEDMLRDYQQNCSQLEKKNEELRKKSLEIIDPSKFIEVRKNIESLDSFIAQSKEYISFLNEKMEDKMESSNQNKSKKLDEDNLKNINVLQRSKSLNDIPKILSECHKKQKTDFKKSRVESSLSEISPTFGKKEENRPKIEFKKSRVESSLLEISSAESKPKIDVVQPQKLPTVAQSSVQPIPTEKVDNADYIDQQEKVEKIEIIDAPTIVDDPVVQIADQQEDDSHSMFAPKEPETENARQTFSNHHFTKSVKFETTPTNSQHLPNEGEKQKQNEQKLLPVEQPTPKSDNEIDSKIYDEIIYDDDDEEENHQIITKVQAEEPRLNVTQPPSCQASNSKPQSQLQMQIQPPLEQAASIRKAPTLVTDMRAFTIEARATPKSSPSQSKSQYQTPVRTSQEQQYNVKQCQSFLALNINSKISETPSKVNVYQEMIEQSTDAYKIIGESDELQMHERKPKKSKHSLNQKKQQKNVEQLVLLSVSSMNQSSSLKTSTNVNSAQVNKFDDHQFSSIGNTTARRRKNVSSIPATAPQNVKAEGEKKQKRFTIYSTEEQQHNHKQIVINPKRRAMIESENNNESTYSTYVKRSVTRRQIIENRVHVTKQKRRSSAAKVLAFKPVKAIKTK